MVNKKIIYILFLCLHFTFFIHGQQTITGKVLDGETNSPLSYIHIYIDNTSLGTTTNDDGEFKLSISEKYKNQTLFFSSLGYNTEGLQIASLLEKKETIIIKLNPANEVLDEVLISASSTKLNATEIVQKSFDNYYKNFPDSPYIAKGFIRHTEKTTKEYKWLTESAFEMHDPGIKKNVAINVLESRKSIDNRHYIDTVRMIRTYLRDINYSSFRKNNKRAENYKTNYTPQFIDEAIAYYDNHYTAGYNKKLSFLEKILSSSINKIRNYNQKNAIFSEKTINKIKFEIDEVLGFGDDKIYKIKFTILFNVKSDAIGLGWLYIKAKNYAIKEIEYSHILGKNHTVRKTLGIKSLGTTIIKYKEYNEKMYPFYMSYKSFKSNSKNIFGYSQDKLPPTDSYSSSKILFSEIITNQETVANTASRIKKSKNSNMFSKKKYNPRFWENYNILLESKEQQKLIKDLEKKVSLKQQFEQN